MKLRTFCSRCERVHACSRCSGADTEDAVVREAEHAARAELARWRKAHAGLVAFAVKDHEAHEKDRLALRHSELVRGELEAELLDAEALIGKLRLEVARRSSIQ